jgi:hypothetical protein
MKQIDVDRAIGVLETYGWIQGHFGQPYEGFCMIGAVTFASYDCDMEKYRDFIRDEQEVETYPSWPLAVWMEETHRVGVAEFNDDPQSSYEDVILRLKEFRETLPE